MSNDFKLKTILRKYPLKSTSITQKTSETFLIQQKYKSIHFERDPEPEKCSPLYWYGPTTSFLAIFLFIRITSEMQFKIALLYQLVQFQKAAILFPTAIITASTIKLCLGTSDYTHLI